MTSNRRVTEDIKANWLEENDHNSDDNFSGDDSEIEDHVSDEDAQDDVEEGYIEDETIENSSDRRAEESVPCFVPENSETLEPSSADHRILVPARRTLKGKNQHCWSTSKGESRGRTTAINIVNTSRGPTRMCRNIFEPSLCFDLFITEDLHQKKPSDDSSIENEGPPPPKKRRYFSYCTSKKKRMSKMTCAKCQKSICGEHQVHVCIECI